MNRIDVVALIGAIAGILIATSWLVLTKPWRRLDSSRLPAWSRVALILAGSSLLQGMSAVTGAGLGAAAANGYALIQLGGSSVTARPTLNFISVNGAVSVADNAGANRTDVTIVTGDGGLPQFPGALAAAYYIDPTNSVGTSADSNNCTSISTQCLTMNAVLAKIATLTNLYQGTWIPIPHTSGTTRFIFREGQPANTDWFPVRFALSGAASIECAAQTSSHTSTFTTVTPRVRAPKASVSSWVMFDTALPTNNGWSTYANTGEILVDTTQGIAAWPQFDLSTDVTSPINKALRSTEWFNTSSSTVVAPVVTHATPVATDAYQLQPTCKLNIGSIDAIETESTNPDANEDTGPRLTFYRVDVQGSQHFALSVRGDSSLITSVESYWDADLNFTSGNNIQFFNSYIAAPVSVSQGSKLFTYGTWVSTKTAEDEPGQLLIQGNAWLLDDSGIAMQSTSTPYSTSLRVQGGASVYISNLGFAIYSTSGIQIDPGGTVITNAAIYGGYGDFRPSVFAAISGLMTWPYTVTAANSFAVNVTSGTDFALQNPGAYCAINSSGQYTCGIAATIANLDTSVASGGFGGHALNPYSQAFLVQGGAPSD